VADLISSEDFYLPQHRQIYEAMIDLYQKNAPIDIVSLSNRLEEKNF